MARSQRAGTPRGRSYHGDIALCRRCRMRRSGAWFHCQSPRNWPAEPEMRLGTGPSSGAPSYAERLTARARTPSSAAPFVLALLWQSGSRASRPQSLSGSTPRARTAWPGCLGEPSARRTAGLPLAAACRAPSRSSQACSSPAARSHARPVPTAYRGPTRPATAAVVGPCEGADDGDERIHLWTWRCGTA